MLTKEITANTPFQPNTESFGLKVYSVPATLMYSVDGNSWTTWEKQITDTDNVVANSAVGLYFMVDQDGVITI